MSYRVNRARGFQRWGVTNPWVFADYGQPQRARGYVSPAVFQTSGPYLKSAHLGEAPEGASAAEVELLRRAEQDLRRSERMERYAIAGVVLSATSLMLAWRFYSGRSAAVRPNRRRRRRTSRKR